MEEMEEQLEDEDIADDGGPDGDEEEEAGSASTARPKDASDGEVESIEELIVKKEAQSAAEDEDEETGISSTREERLEPLAVKVVPPQSSEFICKNCYLVKHRSQLKDKNRMLCRDCA